MTGPVPDVDETIKNLKWRFRKSKEADIARRREELASAVEKRLSQDGISLWSIGHTLGEDGLSMTLDIEGHRQIIARNYRGELAFFTSEEDGKPPRDFASFVEALVAAEIPEPRNDRRWWQFWK
jgi:hypothetical protein